jgi:hypothetical protein
VATDARAFVFPDRTPAATQVPWMKQNQGVEVTTVSFVDRNAPKPEPERVVVAPPPPPSERRSLPPPAALPTPPPGSNSLFPHGPELAVELQGHIAAFAQAIGELAVAKEKAFVAAEAELLELSVAIASAIVERELGRDRETHLVLVRAALRELGGKPEDVRIRASREAHAALANDDGDAMVELEGTSIAISLDPSLTGLGCIVENGDGRVDGTLDQRLESARLAMREAFHARRLSEEG